MYQNLKVNLKEKFPTSYAMKNAILEQGGDQRIISISEGIWKQKSNTR